VVKAKIHTLGGFSAHAGQTELAGWAGHYLGGQWNPTFALTHGQDRPREVLRDLLKARYGVDAILPARGDVQALE
jgi:metallo-beta-lactamase family protein